MATDGPAGPPAGPFPFVPGTAAARCHGALL